MLLLDWVVVVRDINWLNWFHVLWRKRDVLSFFLRERTIECWTCWVHMSTWRYPEEVRKWEDWTRDSFLFSSNFLLFEFRFRDQRRHSLWQVQLKNLLFKFFFKTPIGHHSESYTLVEISSICWTIFLIKKKCSECSECWYWWYTLSLLLTTLKLGCSVSISFIALDGILYLFLNLNHTTFSSQKL